MVSRSAPRSVPDADQPELPRLGRLSGIAAVCFGAGVLWPLLAGYDLAPRPPGSEAREAVEAAAVEAAAAEDPASPGPSSDVEAEVEPPAATVSERQLALIKQSEVTSCKDSRGKAVVPCDRPLLRDAVEPALSRLAQCGAAQGLSGTLSLGLQIDFRRKRIASIKAGNATTIPREKSGALVSCARTELSGVSLKDIAHEQSEYWMYFAVELVPPGTRIEPQAVAADGSITGEIVEASGHATVGWNTAVVRETPAADGAIVTRLLFGTRVKVTGRLGDWYRVNYDAKGRIGWVHRNEVGM
jgi:SH3 domain-containing protein